MLRLAGFELLAPLGVHAAQVVQPAAGQTWRAWSPDGQVVIKFGPTAVGLDASAAVAVRFERERRTAERLQHPGLPRLVAHGRSSTHDAGVPSGLPWAAYAAVDGPDLSRYVQSQPAARLPWTRATTLLARAAEALDHAHRQGVLHRDLKPANLVWAPEGDQLMVIDFGIAGPASLDEPVAADPGADTGGDPHWRTATGVLPGTLGYVAHEVLAGAAHSVASDVFALGVTAFELLGGERPWQGDTPGALFRSFAQDPPLRLDERAPHLPPDLVALVLQMLDRDPRQRPTSMAAVATSLRAAGGVTPVPPAA
jgi:eukaryotic-like serine/threonine-protein kinase